MTERDHGEDRDYPDGSVGRYVREKWGAVPTRPARAARPYVQQVEPPAPRPAPEVESDDENAGERDEAWAYQPDTAWPPRPESRPTVLPQQDGGGSAPSTPPRRPYAGNNDDTETDRTQVHPRSTGTEPQPHDPFAGVAYGSDTWASAREDGRARRAGGRAFRPVAEVGRRVRGAGGAVARHGRAGRRVRRPPRRCGLARRGRRGLCGGASGCPWPQR